MTIRIPSISKSFSAKHSFLFSLISLIAGLFLAGCAGDSNTAEEDTTMTTYIKDTHSYADPSQAVITHLSLDLTADFGIKQLKGTATYDIKAAETATAIVFDSKELTIESIKVDGKEVEFTFGEEKDIFGQPLTVPITGKAKQVVIAYSTAPDAEALQWLNPSQTAGKSHPYLFTQGQAILTRTWIPIQDSPGIRITYDATITVPKDLMAVMSASNPQEKNATGKYQFTMAQPIPPYLIALAIGDITFKEIGARTGVYTEPSMIASSAFELSDMEKMVEAAEALYGPYKWDRFDLIILPPSFPFGGMENPRLTFATPTIIAGDKSLVALVAHELAHSWSGNLVTNATWNDFWLNEGFTVYFELRIMEALYGKSYAAMLTSLGYQGLVETVKDLDERDTHLFLDLEGRNPDDGMTDIAYEKGAHFLMMLEKEVGRATFDAFLRAYFKDHAFQTMNTEKFVAYLKANLLEPNGVTVDIDEWIYGPGLPDNCPVVTSERFDAVSEQATAFIAGKSAESLKTEEWTTHEWLHFLKALPYSLADGQMQDLDNAFNLTQSGNREIQAAWYKLAIYQGYGKEILPSIRTFLIEVGRRKFLTPIYTAMIESGMRAEAISIFSEARPNYHSVSYNTIDALLAETEKG